MTVGGVADTAANQTPNGKLGINVSTVPGSYRDTWRYVAEGTNSLHRYHIFRGLKENDNHSYTQNSLAMIDSIYQLCQWDKEQVYRVPGISLFGGKVICFELSEAEMITA